MVVEAESNKAEVERRYIMHQDKPKSVGTLPQATRTAVLDGLNSTVSVHRDAWSIAHIRADNDRDAFFAQGYVHAQDRLWQMDATRLRMAGRWAEWAGPSAVPGDALARRLDATAASRRDFAALDEQARGMVEAYSAGVNAYLAEGHPLPLEYQLLDAEPEAWQPWHSIAAMRWRGFLMGSVWFKLWRAAALRAIGPEQIAKLRYDDGGTDLLTLPPGAESERWIATLQDLAPAIEALAGLSESDATGGGSNNWAVSPERTATGRPLLAGDPHRVFEMPGMYLQNHLAGASFDAIGLSVPGVPGFPHFAHNGHVAYCVTHAFADIHDLYVEEFDGQGRHRTPDGWADSARRTETLKVRGADDVTLEVIETRHGPVVAGDLKSGQPGNALVLRSVQFVQTDRSFDCLPRMLQARTVETLYAATRGWGLIDHNLVAGDTQGHIGHLVRAIVPRRSRLNGWLPVPGWDSAYDWQGDVPWEEMPRCIDPARGYLATANNRIVADERPGADYLCTDCHPPYRAQRIETLLAQSPQATATDMLAIHADTVSLTAPVFQQCLRALALQSGPAGHMQSLITEWDARMDAGSVGAAAYAAFRWQLAKVLLERSGLGNVAQDSLLTMTPGVIPLNQLWWTLPQLVRANDTALLNGMDWTQASQLALSRAAETFDGRPWGEHHRATLAHPLSGLFPEQAERLDGQGAPVGGDNDTVMATGCQAAGGLKAMYGAISRYVFDVGAWENCRWVVFGGVSGDPDSPHYTDQHAPWARCELVPMHYSWETIAAEGTLTLLQPRPR